MTKNSKMVTATTKQNVIEEVKNNLIENFKNKELNELHLEQTIKEYKVFIDYSYLCNGVYSVVRVRVWSPTIYCVLDVRTRTKTIKTRLINTIIDEIEKCIDEDEKNINEPSNEVTELITNYLNENVPCTYCYEYIVNITDDAIEITASGADWHIEITLDGYGFYLTIDDGRFIDDAEVETILHISDIKEDIVDMVKKHREAA